MNAMPIFDCIYFLENSALYILEVKRTDLPETAEIGEKFKWLRIDKETLAVVPLTFQMMDSSDKVEERYFAEGFLKFNDSDGTYIEKYNAAQHPLFLRKEFVLPTVLTNAIITFLTTAN